MLSGSGHGPPALRRIVLQILHRLPASLVKPYARDIVNQLTEILRFNNEENVIVIVKTISNICAHIEALEDEARAFLDWTKGMFGLLEQMVSDAFDTPTQDTAIGAAQTPGIPQGMPSFKVLSECATAVGSFGLENVKGFVELIQTVLMLQAKPQKKAHAEAKERGEVFIGISKEIKNPEAFGHFISIQVKFLALLEFLLRKGKIQNELPAEFLSILPDIIVRLMRDCPPKAREDLVVTIRWIANYNTKLQIFSKSVDKLLDERAWVGDGLAFHERGRPLAYSALADVIHNLNEPLNLNQFQRVVEIYTRNLLDAYPGASFQTMSALFLLNTTERIAKTVPMQDARQLLIMILNAIGDKFAAMNLQLPTATKLSAQYITPAIDAQAKSYLAAMDDQSTWDEFNIGNAMPIKTSCAFVYQKSMADNLFLISRLHSTRLKNVFYQLDMMKPQKTEEQTDGTVEQEAQSKPETELANRHDVSIDYTTEERKVLLKLVHEGFQVFRYFGVSEPKDTRKLTTATMQQKVESEGKELLETFISIFRLFHPMTFRQIFESEIPHLHRLTDETSPDIGNTLKKFLADNLQPNVVPPSGLSRPILKISSTTSVADNLTILLENVLELPGQMRIRRLREYLWYFNQYPQETCQHFAAKVEKQSEDGLFVQLLGIEEAKPVREAVAQGLDLLSIFSLKEGEEKEKVWAQINAIGIAHSLSKLVITKNEALLEAILESGKYLQKHLCNNDIDPSLRLAVEQAGEQVIDLAVAYLEQKPRKFGLFLEIVEAVTSGHLKSTHAFFHFIYEHMVKADISYWKAVTLQCIDKFADHTTSQVVKTFLFSRVVNPILVNGATTELVDKALIEAIRVKLLRSDLFADATEEVGKLEIERSRVELFQMIAHLLKYHPNLMQYAREDVVKVLCNWADLEDLFSKHAALVVISHFIAAYRSETGFDIMELYRFLLESNYDVYGTMASQALDFLTLVLTEQASGAVSSGQRLPLCASILKTVIAENIHDLKELKTAFNFLIRHYNMFYHARVHLVPLIISALHNFSQVPSQHGEKNRVLGLNLIKMIWLWEERARQESPGLSEVNTESADDGLRLALIENLFWFITYCVDRYPPAVELTTKTDVMPAPPDETFAMALCLLHSFLKLPSWTDVDVDGFFQRFLEPALMKDPAEGERKEHEARLFMVLYVLNVISISKPDDWIMKQMRLWTKLFTNALKIKDAQVRERLFCKRTEQAFNLRPLHFRIFRVYQQNIKVSA